MGRRFALLAGAVAVGAPAGIVLALLSSHTRSAAPPTLAAAATPAATWHGGERRAAGFHLRDERGRAISLRAFRGRDVLITFLDPVCRSLCPVEARTLGNAVRSLGSDAPTVVAVSVNPAADTAANFRSDAREWHLPSRWHWAVGSRAALAPVWRSYGVAVEQQTHRTAGVTVHEVAHTEETYLVDGRGFVRALFIFPFLAADVVRAVRGLGGT